MTLPTDAECPKLAAEATTKVLRNPHLGAVALSEHEIYAMARVCDTLLEPAFKPWRGQHRP